MLFAAGVALPPRHSIRYVPKEGRLAAGVARRRVSVPRLQAWEGRRARAARMNLPTTLRTRLLPFARKRKREVVSNEKRVAAVALDHHLR